jgi:tellurite resistance protein
MNPETAELMTVLAEYGPLCEAMYLMMSADGKITNDEREVLRGALRNLSGDAIRSTHMEAMLDAAGKNVVDHGRGVRMKEVVEQLHDDETRAEVAFVLAAAIAFADNAIADEENETLNALAEGLGIDEARANQLLDDVETDLGERRAEG